MPKKLIIFDLDGVLADTSKIADDYMLVRYPTLTTEMTKEMLTGNFHEEFEKIKLEHARIAETDEEKDARHAAYVAQKTDALLFGGIADFLKRLHERGYILVINTSAADNNCLPLLEKQGVLDLFDFVASSDVSKSKVEKFKMIEEKYGMTNEKTIFVTDTLGDLREARTAGVPTVAVTWGVHDKSYFEREPSENLVAVVDTIGELERVIENR